MTSSPARTPAPAPQADAIFTAASRYTESMTADQLEQFRRYYNLRLSLFEILSATPLNPST